MVVCNRTGHDGESQMIDSESVIVDRGVKLLALLSPESTVFVVNCLIRDEHVVTCEVAAKASVTAETASVRVG
jgi:hypothetical protein